MTGSVKETVGFGCPKAVDPHHFVVELAPGRNVPVAITEMYGVKSGLNGCPEFVERCVLPRAKWNLIADELKREFNERLRSKKMSPSRWTTGANQVERLLGKELLVLAWAVERANPEMIPNALRNWTGLRPEERWWLFNITAAATGTSDDTDVGWRKALRFALCDNPLSEPTHKTSTRQQLLGRSKPLPQMTIFSEFSEEPSPFLPAPKSSSKLQEDSL